MIALSDAGSGDVQAQDTGLGASLSQLANATITSVAGSISQAIGNSVDQAVNPTRSQNGAPAPDIVARASDSAGTFLNFAEGHLSIPLIGVAVAALAYLVLRRK